MIFQQIKRFIYTQQQQIICPWNLFDRITHEREYNIKGISMLPSQQCCG